MKLIQSELFSYLDFSVLIRSFRLQVSDIALAYRVGHLIDICDDLEDARAAQQAAEDHNNEKPGERLLMKPVTCSR